MITESLGEKAYASLLDVPEKIDIVNIFRRSEAVPEVVEQAIQLKVPAIWMQEGVDPRSRRGKGAPGGNLRGDGQVHPEGARKTAVRQSGTHRPASFERGT